MRITFENKYFGVALCNLKGTLIGKIVLGNDNASG